MCGILITCPFPEEKKFKEALLLMAHRGPDETGFVQINTIALGIRRLSIVDLHRGSQPLFNEDKTLALVFNGEIVNCRELEKNLQKKHAFSSRSDGEVVLHGYEEEGKAFFQKLEGMFALALYHRLEKKLYLLRDPFGIKPLYYMTSPFFAASSEIKPLLFLRDSFPSLHLPSLHRHLTYLYDPTEETCFQGIFKLLPGTLLVFDEAKKEEKKEKIFSLTERKSRCTYQEAQEKVTCLLKETVHKHLLSDVPVGAFLSGGVDSSLIVALAQEEKEEMHTFSISFPHYGLYDESPYALKAACALHSYHHPFSFPFHFEPLAKMVYFLEEPVADASFIPFYFLCEQVSQWVKVALSGLGGDEVFFGYNRYIPPQLPFLPSLSFLRKLVLAFPYNSASLSGDTLRLLKKLFPEETYREKALAYLSFNTFFQKRERALVYGPLLKKFVSQNPLEHFSHFFIPPSCTDKIGQWIDFHSYLPGDTLFVADKISMAFGLEVRVPFLYLPLVRFALSLPVGYHFHAFKKKRLLKEVSQPYLPAEIIRRRKHGFSVPVDLWLRSSWLPLLRKAFAPRRVKKLGFFSYSGIWQMVEEHVSYKRDYSQHLFQLFIFDLFHRLYFEQNWKHSGNIPLSEIYG